MCTVRKRCTKLRYLLCSALIFQCVGVQQITKNNFRSIIFVMNGRQLFLTQPASTLSGHVNNITYVCKQSALCTQSNDLNGASYNFLKASQTFEYIYYVLSFSFSNISVWELSPKGLMAVLLCSSSLQIVTQPFVRVLLVYRI